MRKSMVLPIIYISIMTHKELISRLLCIQLCLKSRKVRQSLLVFLLRYFFDGTLCQAVCAHCLLPVDKGAKLSKIRFFC